MLPDSTFAVPMPASTPQVPRGQPTSDSLVDAQPPAQLARQRLWEPLAKHLTDVATLFVCGDDFLAQVPFGAIEIENGRHALELYSETKSVWVALD